MVLILISTVFSTLLMLLINTLSTSFFRIFSRADLMADSWVMILPPNKQKCCCGTCTFQMELQFHLIGILLYSARLSCKFFFTLDWTTLWQEKCIQMRSFYSTHWGRRLGFYLVVLSIIIEPALLNTNLYTIMRKKYRVLLYCKWLNCRRRCKKYYIEGEKKGHVDTFIENLPGVPDNIRYDGEGKYWIALPMV